MDFEIGKIYYDLVYHDHELLCPHIVPVVYIGKNIANDESPDEDIWYFQYSESVAKHGQWGIDGGCKGTPEVNARGLDVIEGILDEQGLYKELQRCAARRSRSTS